MFKFGFEDSEPSVEPPAASETVPAQLHGTELIKQDYPRISFTALDLNGVQLPRRDIFDVRYQLMAMDELDDQMKVLLGDEDVRKNVYEGGLKVWEGSLDLVEVLSAQDEWSSSVIELGCGAAVPACYLLYNALKSGRPCRLVLADYNVAILRLLTLPNCILAWLAATKGLEPRGEINLTADLVQEFEEALAAAGIELQFVSGGWSKDFSQLVGGPFGLVLASETIYSLDSLDAFCGVLSRAVGDTGVGLVAAKKVYFGVGGSVVEFEKRVRELDVACEVVSTKGDVGRVVVRAKRA